MGDATGQYPQALQFLCVLNLAFKYKPLFFEVFTFSDVPHHRKDHGAPGEIDHRGIDFHGEFGSGLSDMGGLEHQLPGFQQHTAIFGQGMPVGINPFCNVECCQRAEFLAGETVPAASRVVDIDKGCKPFLLERMEKHGIADGIKDGQPSQFGLLVHRLSLP